MWRCVRGSAFNRCGCLAVYWQCLVDRACGPTTADAQLCADRSSGLLCSEYDESTGLRVCPDGAGTVYESSAGWIVAVVAWSLSTVVFLVTLVYVAAVRGWVRKPSGSLWIGGDPPIEALVSHAAAQRWPSSSLAQRAVRAPQSPIAAGGEPPDLILVTPAGIDRYRDYLRGKLQDRRDAGEVLDLPALLRSPEPSDRVARRRLPTALERQLEEELAALQKANATDQQNLAAKALELDIIDREVDNQRARFAAQLEAERRAIVRELAVGRESARMPLPTELVVTTDGLRHQIPIERANIGGHATGAPNPIAALFGEPSALHPPAAKFDEARAGQHPLLRFGHEAADARDADL